MILLSIDPGTKKNAGWAWFGPQREWTKQEGTQHELHACGVGTWDTIPVGGLGVTVVIERPQIYRAIKSKADPNDMVKLGWIAGEIAQRARAAGSTVGQYDDHPRPQEWKGGVEKEMMIRRIWKHLPPNERAVVDVVKCAATLRGNMIDAIGIGAWWLRERGLR